MAAKRGKLHVMTFAALAKMAGERCLPAYALDDELKQACDDEAELLMENIQSSSLHDQLEFLYLHGHSLEELRELIVERSPLKEEENK